MFTITVPAFIIVGGKKQQSKIQNLRTPGSPWGALGDPLGTAWGRESVHENLWVDLLMAQIERSESHLVVIDDVRFPNESTAIRNRGGFTVELSLQ